MQKLQEAQRNDPNYTGRWSLLDQVLSEVQIAYEVSMQGRSCMIEMSCDMSRGAYIPEKEEVKDLLQIESCRESIKKALNSTDVSLLYMHAKYPSIASKEESRRLKKFKYGDYEQDFLTTNLPKKVLANEESNYLPWMKDFVRRQGDCLRGLCHPFF